MDLVLAEAKWSACLVYLDDIVIVGKTFHQHLANVRDVLDKLRQAGLRLKPGNVLFSWLRSITWGTYIVSDREVATDHVTTEKVATWSEPETLAEVQAFLGLASDYRWFIKNFAAIATPLHRLKKGREFCWTQTCADAFRELKHRLTATPILAFPDYILPFILDNNASGTGIGAVLSQVQDGEEE